MEEGIIATEGTGRIRLPAGHDTFNPASLFFASSTSGIQGYASFQRERDLS